LDGSLATRKASGRRLDNLLTSPALTRCGPATRVYDCADEGRPGGLPLSGAPLAATVCTLAADHLPVFADLIVPTAVVAQTLRINDAARAEGQSGTSPLTFTLTLSSKSAGPVTVRYATANGTAQASQDYPAARGQMTFAQGQTSKTLAIAVTGDLARDGNKVLFVNLTQATGANLADAQGQGMILNDDGPVLAIGDVTLAEGHSGTRTANFRVGLSLASTSPVTVKYATANGTAQAGSDYVAKSGSLTIAAGQRVQSVGVLVRVDRVKEGSESFFVDLSGAVGGGDDWGG
jgi:chitinase